MATVCPLFSGSTGNSTYIAAQNGAILVDAGASLKAITSAVDNMGGSIEKIAAVAVTHTHGDHICGIKAVLNKTKAPIVASKQTIEYLASHDKIPSHTEIIEIDSKSPVEIAGFGLSFFDTPHDCEGSGGYSVFLPDGKKMTVCTDLGVVTEDIRKSLMGSNCVLLESNHDITMLKNGPYPPQLKVRILSDQGHISNLACAAELQNLLKSGTTRFVLGHLSQQNNMPMLAKSTSENALADMGAKNGEDYILRVAAPTGNGVTVF